MTLSKSYYTAMRTQFAGYLRVRPSCLRHGAAWVEHSTYL